MNVTVADVIQADTKISHSTFPSHMGRINSALKALDHVESVLRDFADHYGEDTEQGDEFALLADMVEDARRDVRSAVDAARRHVAQILDIREVA